MVRSYRWTPTPIQNHNALSGITARFGPNGVDNMSFYGNRDKDRMPAGAPLQGGGRERVHELHSGRSDTN